MSIGRRSCRCAEAAAPVEASGDALNLPALPLCPTSRKNPLCPPMPGGSRRFSPSSSGRSRSIFQRNWPAATTGIVDRLEKLGHVRRSNGLADRRRIFVQMTPSGAALVGKVHDAMVTNLLKMMDVLEPGERKSWLQIYEKSSPTAAQHDPPFSLRCAGFDRPFPGSPRWCRGGNRGVVGDLRGFDAGKGGGGGAPPKPGHPQAAPGDPADARADRGGARAGAAADGRQWQFSAGRPAVGRGRQLRQQ